MIHLRYLAEAIHEDFSEDAQKFLIVRSPQGKIPKEFIHFPHFSPSSELLTSALRWKSGEFTRDEEITCLKNGISKRNPNSWWTLYKPVFLKELETREDVGQGVRLMRSEINKNRDVYLFCYCKELDTCHRLLVGEHLENLGFEVDYGRKKEEKKTEENSQISMF